VDYVYDVNDNRIAKVVDLDGAGTGAATTERYVYDGDQITLVFDGSGTLKQRYLYGTDIDQVLAEEANGQTRWLLADHQGTVRQIVDNAGTLLNQISYDSFGNLTNQTNASVTFRFGYTGREFDSETGQYYYRSRYYDPKVGRFTSEDGLGFGAGDTNLSRYVFNSPTNFTDPSGRLTFDWNPVVDALYPPVPIPGAYPFLPPATRPYVEPYLNQLGLPRIKLSINAGEDIAKESQCWYAKKFVDPNTPAWQKPDYFLGGATHLSVGAWK
jgi:RHS repeat-associated protein